MVNIDKHGDNCVTMMEIYFDEKKYIESCQSKFSEIFLILLLNFFCRFPRNPRKILLWRIFKIWSISYVASYTSFGSTGNLIFWFDPWRLSNLRRRALNLLSINAEKRWFFFRFDSLKIQIFPVCICWYFVLYVVFSLNMSSGGRKHIFMFLKKMAFPLFKINFEAKQDNLL